jgi:hypothetical protein
VVEGAVHAPSKKQRMITREENFMNLFMFRNLLKNTPISR